MVAILKLKTIHSIIITSEIFIPSNTQGVLGTKKDKFIVHIHDKMSQLPPSGGETLCVKMKNVNPYSNLRGNQSFLYTLEMTRATMSYHVVKIF